MLKPLTLSLSLAVALGAASMSLAGHHGKSMPSAQCETPSAQCAPSAQCETPCAPKKHCALFDLFKPKPKCYSYEWVLKKKRCGGGLFGKHHKGGDCGEMACDSCGDAYPSAQWPSAQGGVWGSGQAYVGGHGSGQMAPAGQIAPAPAMAPPAPPAAEPPPAPDAAPPPPPPAAPTALLNFSPAGN